MASSAVSTAAFTFLLSIPLAETKSSLPDASVLGLIFFFFAICLHNEEPQKKSNSLTMPTNK